MNNRESNLSLEPDPSPHTFGGKKIIISTTPDVNGDLFANQEARSLDWLLRQKGGLGIYKRNNPRPFPTAESLKDSETQFRNQLRAELNATRVGQVATTDLAEVILLDAHRQTAEIDVVDTVPRLGGQDIA